MFAVAIDGPAGAGKSTIAKAVAKELQYIYVDTGALYRAIGLFGYRCGADTTCAEQIVPLLAGIKVELRYVDGEQHVLLGDEDVSEAIRENAISMAASNVSAIPEVRAFLFDLQRDLANQNNVVMDGRDIGTVVLPNAQVKVFLTASPEERTRRRCRQLEEKGIMVDYEQMLKEVIQRDHNDSSRAVAPLKQAQDAVLLDTTGMTLEESVQAMTRVIKEKLRHDV